MGLAPSLKQWTREKLRSVDLNLNFSKLRDTVNNFALLADISRGVSAVFTFSARQVFQGGANFDDLLRVNAGGLYAEGGTFLGGGNTTVDGILTATLPAVFQLGLESGGPIVALGQNLDLGTGGVQCGAIAAAGTISASIYQGSAVELTGYKLSNLVIDVAYPAGSGANLTALNANNFGSGTVKYNYVDEWQYKKSFRQINLGGGSGPELGCIVFDPAFQTVGATAVPAMTAPAGFSSWVWVKVSLSGGSGSCLMPVLSP